jgi:hypothetical protein
MVQTKYVVGIYEAEENILHLSHPKPIMLNTPQVMEDFFREVMYWIRSCPVKPYLLVNYTNVEIAVDITQEYSRQLRNYRPMVLEVYRYGLSHDLTGSFTTMAVRMGNMKSATNSNIYPDEATARQALRKAREEAARKAGQG